MMTVLGAGARTAIGATLLETSLSLRAGIQRMRRAPFVDDAGEPFLVAPVLEMRRSLEGTERGVALAHPALAELEAYRPAWEGKRAGLVLALETRWPIACPSGSQRLSQWLEALEEKWRDFPGALISVLQDRGWSIQSDRVAGVRGDSSALVLGLNTARHWLESGAIDVCLVGGVAASCEAPWLMLLDDHQLTLSSKRDDGVVVGEAAAFVLLGRDGPGPIIRSWSRQGESDGRALRPQTIAQALRDVATTLAGPTELSVMFDANGLTERTKRWSFAETRALGTRQIMTRKVQPATFLGDVSVATLPLYLGLASHASSGRTLVALAHGFDEAAGAVLIEPDASA